MIWLLIIIAVAALLLYKPEVKTESVIGVDSPIIPESDINEYDVPVYNYPPTDVINKPGGENGVLGINSPIIAKYSGGGNGVNPNIETTMLQNLE
jgi:hypothetical protein